MRTDYYNDPDAPRPNSVVPSASAIVTDELGRILLIKRRDNELWALPGGGHAIGETIEETAIREVKEETGLDVEIVALTGIYTDPAHVVAFSNGEVRQQFSLCFTTRQKVGRWPLTTRAPTSPGRAPTTSGRSICIPR
jgi:ADP-ribose pyrophosphatase YjhB (NUDIX family)